MTIDGGSWPIKDEGLIREMVAERIAEMSKARVDEEAKKLGVNNDVEPEHSDKPLPLSFLKACERWCAAGFGELYKELHRGKFLYDRSSGSGSSPGSWLKWTGHHWEYDTNGDAIAAVGWCAIEFEKGAASIRRGFTDETPKEERAWQEKLIDRFEKAAARLRTKNGVEQTLFFAANSEDSLSISGEEIDTKPHLLALKNGVMDLRTGRFADGQPGDFLLKAVPHEFKGYDAPAPIFKDAVSKIFMGDQEVIDCFQRVCGAALWGGNPDQRIIFCHGETGSNGKNLLFDTFCSALGPLASPIQSGTLLQAAFSSSPSAPTPDIMQLKGLRMAVASENDDFARIAHAKVKELVGNEYIVARGSYQKSMCVFRSSHTIFLLTNNPPKADGSDSAFWRRVVLFEFPARFVERPAAENEFQIDTDLKSKLANEIPGILAWLVDGALRWKKFGLAIPAKIQEAANQYRANEDVLGIWIDERCLVGDGLWSWANELHDDFAAWWSDNISNNPPKPQKFGRWMRKRFKHEKPSKIRYIGIALRYEGQS